MLIRSASVADMRDAARKAELRRGNVNARNVRGASRRTPTQQLQSLIASLGGWWWDKRYGITITGSGVSSWVERSNVFSLLQGTDSKRPPFNAVTGLTFTAAGVQTLLGAANILNTKTEYTVFVFGSIAGAASNYAFAYGAVGGPDIGLYGGAAGLSGYIRAGGVVNQWTSALTTPFALAVYMAQGKYSDGTAAEKVIQKDAVSGGGASNALDVTGGVLGAASMSLGAYVDSTVPMDCVIRHVVLIPTQIAQANISAINAYLHAIEGVLSATFCAGDSTTVGSLGLLGGWRLGTFAALGSARTPTGPFTNIGGAHRGVGGEKASDVAAALGTFATQLTSYQPKYVVLAWGANDLGLGGSTAALATSLNAIIDQVQATLPSAVIVVQSIVPPTVGHAYFANLANFTTANSTTIPGLCTAQGVKFANIGSPDNTIANGGDGLHPLDTPAGYTSMVAPIVSQLQ